MRQVLRLFANSYRLFLNDRVAVLLTFILPLVLMSIFGSIFGGSASSPQGIPLALLNQSNSGVIRNITAVLDTTRAFRIVKSYKRETGEEEAFDTSSIKAFVRAGSASGAVVFPPDAYTDTSVGVALKFYYDPKNEIEMQILQGLVRQAVYSQIPSIISESGFRQSERVLGTESGRAFNAGLKSLVGKYFRVDTAVLSDPSRMLSRSRSGDSASSSPGFFAKLVRIDQEQLVGQQLQNPWATRSVGGWAMTFLLFALTASSSSLFDEKESGVMLRLLSSPVSRLHILWSKYLYNMSLGILQLLFMFTAGWIMYRIDVWSHFLDLLLVIVAASFACTSFGMLLAAFAQTRQQAAGLGTLLILSMSAIGGSWFPTSLMPSNIQFFSKLTFVYWSMDGFLQVLWRGVGASAIMLNLGILFGTGALITAISVWRFRRGHIFD